MSVGLLGGCSGQKETEGLNDTNLVDRAIENASLIEDASGFTYTGEGPISLEGGTLKLLAQK